MSWRPTGLLPLLALAAMCSAGPVRAQADHPVPAALAIDIVFSIDSSGSMGPPPQNTPEKYRDLFGNDIDNKRVAAVRLALTHLDPELHQAGLVSWDDKLDFTVALTSAYGTLGDRLQDIDAVGGTNLKLGLGAALDLLEASERAGAKRVVVFLTDGLPLNDQGEIDPARNIDETLIERARRLDATVYAIGLDVPERAKAVLERTASETGGRFFEAPDADALDQIFLDILEEVRDVFLQMTPQDKRAIAGPDAAVVLSLSLVDRKGRTLLARKDIAIALRALVRRATASPEEKSEAQQLDPQRVVIEKGAASTSFAYTGLEPGMLEVSATSPGFPSLAAKTALPVEKPLPPGTSGERPIRLRLVHDVDSAPVGRPVMLAAVAVDDRGRPVPVDRDYAITFELRPVALGSQEASAARDALAPTVGWITTAHAQTETPHRTVREGEFVTVSLGPLDLKARLPRGQSMFSFTLASKEAWLFSVTLDSDLGRYVGERLLGAFASTHRPEGFELWADKAELRADGRDQSRLKLVLVAKRGPGSTDTEPVCGGDRPLSIALSTSLGALSRSQLQVPRGPCTALLPGAVILQAGHRPGTAVVRAGTQGLELFGMRGFDVIAVQPGWQLLVALIGGTIGAVLAEHRCLRHRRARIEYRALAGPFLVIGALVGLLFYIALYYGVRLVPTPVPFSSQPVFALLIGALGGFFGPRTLELLAGRYGLRQKKHQS
jgi:hypothetical protein